MKQDEKNRKIRVWLGIDCMTGASEDIGFYYNEMANARIREKLLAENCQITASRHGVTIHGPHDDSVSASDRCLAVGAEWLPTICEAALALIEAERIGR